MIPFTAVVAIILAIVLMVFIPVAYLRRWTWTGFVVPPGATTGSTKTLWDWLEVVAMPIVVVGYAALFSLDQALFEAERAEDRERVDQAIALDAQRERTLQDYFDEMTTLILDREVADPPGDQAGRWPALVVAETRTLATLRSLDGARKGQVMQFLAHSDLIRRIDDQGHSEGGVMFLNKPDLSRADLRAADLCGVALYAPNLTDAVLDDADIALTWFIHADLSGAKVRNAYAAGAVFSDANINGADFGGTTLTQASFTQPVGTDTSFEGADLRDARVDLKTLVHPRLTGAVVSPDSVLLDMDAPPALETRPLDHDGEPTCGDIIPVAGPSATPS